MSELLSPTPVTSVDVDDVVVSTRLGPELAAVRRSMSPAITQRDMANQLNLSLHVIECLEADKFDDLPPRLFVRGYIIAYVKLLQLPVDQVLRQFDSVYPPVAEKPVPPVQPSIPSIRMRRSARRLMNRKGKRRWLRRSVFLVLVLAVIVLTYRWVESGAQQIGVNNMLIQGSSISLSSGKTPLVLKPAHSGRVRKHRS